MISLAKMINIPHLFTLLRIVMTPLFLLFYLEHEALGIPFASLPYLLLSLLFLCECSDLFDGFLARRLNQVTDLGKILDPVADSIMHTSLFLAFTHGPVQLPLWYVLLFLYRDMLMSTLRTLCALRGFALAARLSGKVKTALQATACFAVVALMIPLTLGWISLASFQGWSHFCVGIAAIGTLLSIVDYVRANWASIRGAMQRVSAN